MSAPRFTPAPWRVDAEPYGSGMARFVRAGSGKFPVATLHGNPRPAEQTEANARLIAASPELYEALEKCRDKFAEYAELHRRKLGTQRPLDSFEHQTIIQKVERNRDMADMCIAALAKARGEQA